MENYLKSFTMPKKKTERGTLWDFSTFCRKTPKKLKRGPFGGKLYPEKFSQCRKKLKGGTLWSRPVVYVTRETFLVQFLGPRGTIWRLLKNL